MPDNGRGGRALHVVAVAGKEWIATRQRAHGDSLVSPAKRRTTEALSSPAGRSDIRAVGAGDERRAAEIVEVGAGGCGVWGRDGAGSAAQLKEPWEAGLDRIHAADRRSCRFAIAGRLQLGHMHGTTHRPRFRRPGEPVSASSSRNRKINEC